MGRTESWEDGFWVGNEGCAADHAGWRPVSLCQVAQVEVSSFHCDHTGGSSNISFVPV